MKFGGRLGLTVFPFPLGLRQVLRASAILAAALVAVATVAAAALAAPASAASTSAGGKPTVVSFTFDNNWQNQMAAAADLQAHGMNGTFYIISGWIGLPGFLSMSDLQTLVADGDEIGGKTVSNPQLPDVSNAEAEREICQGRDVLLNDGFNVTDFAYPFAEMIPADETIAAECGFNSARNVGNVEDPVPGGCHYPDCEYAESIPPADPYNINTPGDIETGTLLSTMETEVTNAENHGGGWLAFNLHQVCAQGAAGCDPLYSTSPTLFNTFLTWLKGQEGRGGVQVKTVQQVIGGPLRPAVTAPTAAPAPAGVNALANAGLTAGDPTTPTEPDCWTQDSYGTSTPAFNWSTTGGEGGGGQETISETGLTSGDATLITRFDLGQCAPTAVTGHAYQLSLYYKSSAPVFFTVYGRSATGVWSYWTQSPTFAAASGWTKATWLTPAVPSTVQALSFGMSLPSDGTLSTSNYSLSDAGNGVPPAAPVGANALQNAQLTTPDGSGSAPQCWAQEGYGTNSPTYSWSPTGGEAGGEETLSMAGLTSGDAKLVPTFDSGNCAPTAVPGDTYTVSVYYKSTVPVFFTLYGRSATDGSWAYWTQSPAFAPASTWTQATFTAVAPATINGASFGMTIPSNGTLSTSNYSLVNEGSAG